MVTVKDLENLALDYPTHLPVYVQSGYNIFKINAFVEKYGCIILILDQDASNQSKEEA